MDDRDDDRPNRRDDRFEDDDTGRPGRRPGPPKKSNTLKIVLIVLGIVGVLCAGGCGIFSYWAYSVGTGAQKAADGVLTKVGSGDIAGAYGSMSANYKAATTQQQFEDKMKAAKLTDYASVDWQPPRQAGNGEMVFSGTAKLKSGGTTPVSVTVKMLPDFKTWEVDDLGDGTGRPAAPPGRQ